MLPHFEKRVVVVVTMALANCGAPEDRVGPEIAAFAVSPSIVDAGVATELSWHWSYASEPTSRPVCTIQGVGEVEELGSTSISLREDTTFTLECASDDGVDSSTVTVVVTAVPMPPRLHCIVKDRWVRCGALGLRPGAEVSLNADLHDCSGLDHGIDVVAEAIADDTGMATFTVDLADVPPECAGERVLSVAYKNGYAAASTEVAVP